MSMLMSAPVRPSIRPFVHRPRRPFAALIVPVDIKRQITEERIQEITFCSFEQCDDDPELCLCYIEFSDNTCDEWELPFQLSPRIDERTGFENPPGTYSYEWQNWWGWKLAYRGEIDEIGEIDNEK